MNNENIDSLEVLSWNENFETGFVEIDEQHKKLVLLLNLLANDLTYENSYNAQKTLNTIIEFTKNHFEWEENFWNEKMGNSSFLTLEHKKSHDLFINNLNKLFADKGEVYCHNLIEEVLLFLIKWIILHIIDEDKKMTLVIKSIQSSENINIDNFCINNHMHGNIKIFVDSILLMYDNLSLKTIKLIRERKARIQAQEELKKLNKELEKLSITDSLTQLYNRRHFKNIFEMELNKSKRNKTLLSLIYIDIDYFKKINDTYGHIVGDDTLIQVSNCLKNVCKRANDFIFRMGGEEFSIIITNEDATSPIQLANILRNEIKLLAIPNKNSLISDYLTVSIGIISKVPEIDEDISVMMNLADERLYKAKIFGRDRIINE